MWLTECGGLWGGLYGVDYVVDFVMDYGVDYMGYFSIMRKFLTSGNCAMNTSI